MKIPCYLEVDEASSTVTMRHAKTRCIVMMIKLEAGAIGTMLRVDSQQDCDNYWLGLKPADGVVFMDGLFSEKQLHIKQLDFELKAR